MVGHTPELLRNPLGLLERASVLGDVVKLRLGLAPVWLVNAPQAIHAILVTDANAYDKGFQFDRLRVLIGNGIATSTGSKHRRTKRMVSPTLHQHRLPHYQEVVTAATTELISGWRSGQVVEMAAAMREVAMTGLTRTLFRTDLPITQTLADLPVLLDGIGLLALVPPRVMTIAPTRFARAATRLHRIVDDAIARRRAEPTAGRTDADVLGMLMAAVDEDGRTLTDAEIHDEIMTEWLAGTEAPAGVLAWIVHLLAQDPDLQSAVREDIAGGDRDPIGPIDTTTLTDRVVREAMRLYPPAWVVGRRPTQPVSIAGRPIQPRSQVLVNFYGMHRRPDVYRDPTRFAPDRWLDLDPDVVQRHYLPFGSGPHRCIGDAYALMQIRVALRAILSRFTLAPVPGSMVRPVARTIMHPDAVPLLLTRIP